MLASDVALDFNEIKRSLPDLGEKDQNVYPRVELATLIHRIERVGVTNSGPELARLLSYVERHRPAHLYKYICDKNIVEFDEGRYAEMLMRDKQVRETLDRVVASKDEYSTNNDVCSYYANYLSFVGDRAAAEKLIRQTLERCANNSQKIEHHLHLCRIGFFYLDRTVVKDSLEAIENLVRRTGDWHLKNIAYAYVALNSLWNRDMRRAALNFLSCVSSFTSFDLMSLGTFCVYTTMCAMLVLPRDRFFNKIISGSEVQEGLFQVPIVAKLAESFYTCEYSTFTENLKLLVLEMKNDPFCAEHVDYLCREFRLRAYRQLLASFKSLTLEYLSQVFGLSKTFIENDIARFVAKGDLDCKIDLVREMVIVSLFDKKKREFSDFIEESTRLIADIQFMERTVNE